MNNWLKQVKDGWNKTSDSDWYNSLRSDEKIQTLLKSPVSAFHPEVFALIMKHFPDLKGKKVLLPSSGDNHAAFAFALLGADVTSSDISERQLENAAVISNRLGLNIRYVCDDTMTLENIENNCFDLVYTSNGTHVWITDLVLMYKNIHRVLKDGGYSIMFDIHPFNRPFVGDPWQQLQIKKSYFDAHRHRHWRIQDLVNAMTNSDLLLIEMAEMQATDGSFWFSYDDLIKQNGETLQNINDWKHNPMAALPAWITILTQKRK